MKTSEMIDVLRSVEGFVIVDSGDPGEKLVCTAEHFKEIGDRLEELEAALAERECGTMKASSPTMEWISVEDRLPREDDRVLVFTKTDYHIGLLIVEDADSMKEYFSCWMPLPEPPPKPKVPTFKDVFLEKFPNASVTAKRDPKTCRNLIFGKGRCDDDDCAKCWNQPYFEEEGETDA